MANSFELKLNSLQARLQAANSESQQNDPVAGALQHPTGSPRRPRPRKYDPMVLKTGQTRGCFGCRILHLPLVFVLTDASHHLCCQNRSSHCSESRWCQCDGMLLLQGYRICWFVGQSFVISDKLYWLLYVHTAALIALRFCVVGAEGSITWRCISVSYSATALSLLFNCWQLCIPS